MKKLNEVLNTCKVTAFGFPAIQQLAEMSNQDGPEVVISTLPAAVMMERGIWIYYAPMMPRDSKFSVGQDIVAADLGLQEVTMMPYPSWDHVDQDRIVIVTRHAATAAAVKSLYPDAPVLDGDVTADDIEGCHIIGGLPPHLAAKCCSFRAASIRDYDYVTDGDLSGDALRDRLFVTDPVTVAVK